MKLSHHKENLYKDAWVCENEETQYGLQNQLKLLGRCSESGLYLVKCDVCAQDAELYGEGVFETYKINLLNNKMPCGCSKMPKWTKEQFSILCKRAAKSLGYEFIDFHGEWKGSYTKVKLLCSKHGEWIGSKIGHLLNSGAGCPKCKIETVAKSKMKPDSEMIKSFILTGAFSDGTKFRRMDKAETGSLKYRWEVVCPVCGEKNISLAENLQAGKVPCICSNHRQTFGYINKVENTAGDIVAIKFGVTNNIRRRVWEQNRVTNFTVSNLLTYEFLDRKSCRNAETECKKLLDCGLLSRVDLPDGWSETVDTSLAYKIVETYERSGGILISGDRDNIFRLALDWFINSLHSVPEEVLDLISHKIHVEIMERNNSDTPKED